MKYKNKYKLFKIQKGIRKMNKSFLALDSLVAIFQFICATFLLLQNIKQLLIYSIEGMGKVFSSVDQNYLTLQTANLFTWIGNAIHLGILILEVIRFKLTSSYDEVSRRPKIERFLYIFVMILGYCAQITIIFSTWSFSEIQNQEGFPYAILKCILPFLSYSYFNFTNQTLSLFSWQTIPIILLITFQNGEISNFFLLVILIYRLLQNIDILRKVLTGLFIILVLFIFNNSISLFNTNQTKNNSCEVSFLCLAISFLLTPILILKARQKLYSKSSEEMVEEVYQNLKQSKGQIPHTSLPFDKFYQMHTNVQRLMLSNKQTAQSYKQQNISEKQFSAITKNEYLVFVQAYLDKQCKKSSADHTMKLILLVKVRMTLNYPLQTIIQDLFLVLEELQKLNGKDETHFFLLFEMIMKKYAIYKQEQLETSQTIYLNQINQSFEAKVYEIIDLLNKFWSEIASQQVLAFNINNKFKKILSQKDKLQQKYQSMIKIGNFQKQRNVMLMIKSIFNPYQVQKSQTSLSIQLKDSIESQKISFLVIENDTIKFASKQFVKSLGEVNESIYENISKTELFGEELVSIVDSLVKNLKSQTQKAWTTIPLWCKKGFIRIKKIRILWYPSLSTRNKLMIKFDDDIFLQKDSYMVYHFKTDTIRYFTEEFITNFTIDTDKIFYQLNNYHILFNQLFINLQLSFEDTKTNLKQQNSIRCTMYLKKYVEKGSLYSFPVEVKVYQSIVIDNQLTYSILKVSKLNDKKQKSSTTNDQSNTSKQRQQDAKKSGANTSNQEVLAKIYQNQQFFCKIPNNYENKITQKQAQLQETGRFSFIYLIHAMFGLVICVILILWLLNYQFLKQRIEQYKKGITAVQNTSEQYALLYQTYSVALKRYYMAKYPLQTLLVRKVPASVYNQVYIGVEQTFLDDFLNRYLTQINSPPNRVIDYSIDFERFSIKTNTQMSTLMDFAENIKRNIINETDIEFLLNNYDNFRNLTITYQSSFNTQQTLNDVIKSYVMYMWIGLSIVVLMCLLLTLLTCRIQNTIDMVYELMGRFDHKELLVYQDLFDQSREKIAKIFKRSSPEKQKPKQPKQLNLLTACRSIKDQLIDSSRNINSQEEMISESSINNLKRNQSLSRSRSKKSFDSFENENQIGDMKDPKVLRESNVKNVIKDPVVIKIVKNSFFFVLLTVFIFAFIQEVSYLNYERDGMIQLLDIKKQFYMALIHIKRQEVDSPIIPTMENYFNKSIDDKYFKSNVELVASIPNKILLQQFKSFGPKASKALTQNMCDFIGLTIRAALKPCQSYMNGFVTKGFAQVYSPYIQNAKKVANMSMVEFGPYPCTVAKCSYYFEHEFTSILLGQTTRYFVNMLNMETEVAFQKLLSRSKSQTILKMFGLIIVCIIYLFYASYLRSKCRTALQFFGIIPKNIMCSMKMTTYLRKNKILSKLDIL